MGGHARILAKHVALNDEFDDLAKRVDIGTLVCLLAFEQFGSNKLVLLDEQFVIGFIIRFWQPDVDDLGPGVVGGHHDVLRFQVAVHDAALVHIVERIADVNEDALDLFLVEGAYTHMFGQRLAINEFVDDAFAQTGNIFKTQGPTDKLMLELAGDLIFLLQVLAALDIFRKFLFQSLQNHLLTIINRGKQPAVPV